MVNINLIGHGYVGGELLNQLAKYAAKKGAANRLFVTGIIGLEYQIVASSSKPLNLTTWEKDLETGAHANLATYIDEIATAGAGEPVVIVDCTASDFIAGQYPAWLSRGLHIVTPNKKAFSGPLDLFKSIQRLTTTPGPKRPLCFHESSVGAGLPIISTLNDLVNTQDEIVSIEGIFSGTLSYLFNNFSSATPSANPKSFSEIVAVAKKAGYTEPDPRDDLNGLDVARKVVILGRLAGLDLDLSTLSIQNIVPEQLRSEPTADAFMAKLAAHDAHFAALNDAARARSKVLRYVGKVDVQNPAESFVRLVEYDAGHPFASLTGSDNIISFTTKRWVNSLIVQGAGAGAEVTAFGCFADILKIEAMTGY